MIVVIDNYDSFVHNLARYAREGGAQTRVIRNDAASVREILHMKPRGVILSPGPKTPKEAGVSCDLIAALPPQTPLLGVCLGHQCLVEVFGGKTVRADSPLHGGASTVCHTGEGVFAGVPSPAIVGRYHSLIASSALRDDLIETAWTEDGALMGVSHKTRPWHGVQFHPESVLTPDGRKMMANFLAMCGVEAAR